MKPEFFEQNFRKSGLVAGAAAFMIVAGLIHFAIVPLHWGHSPAHALFLALSGTVEIAWGVAFWSRPTFTFYRLGIVTAAALIALWAITRVLPAPFSDGPEEIEAFGLVSKFLEGIGLAALAVLGFSEQVSRESARFNLFVSVLVGLVLSGVGYGIAEAGAPRLPWLNEAATSADVAPAATERRGASDSLELVLGGIPSPYVKGSEIPLGGDVIAQVTVMPGDGRYSRRVNLRLSHETSGQGVDDASVQVTGRMRYMDHGTFREVAEPSGGGNYLLPLNFPMLGEWQVDLEIVASRTRDTLQLNINLFD